MRLSFYTTHTFDKQFKRLDSKIQSLFLTKLEYLLKTPKYPSLNSEKLVNDLYSFRVNKNFRVIFKYRSKTEVELIYIANHDVYRKIKML